MKDALEHRTRLAGLIYHFDALVSFIKTENNGEVPDDDEIKQAIDFFDKNRKPIMDLATGAN